MKAPPLKTKSLRCREHARCNCDVEVRSCAMSTNPGCSGMRRLLTSGRQTGGWTHPENFRFARQPGAIEIISDKPTYRYFSRCPLWPFGPRSPQPDLARRRQVRWSRTTGWLLLATSPYREAMPLLWARLAWSVIVENSPLHSSSDREPCPEGASPGSMSSIKRDVKKKVLPRPESEVSFSRSSPL
jgi:hypothetical protein